MKCDCSATDLKLAIEGKLSVRYIQLISEMLICKSGEPLQGLDYKDLNCPLEDNDKSCSNHGCSCTLNEHFKQVTINCSSSEMSNFPANLIQIADSHYSINLDLREAFK